MFIKFNVTSYFSASRFKKSIKVKKQMEAHTPKIKQVEANLAED